MSEQIMKFRL